MLDGEWQTLGARLGDQPIEIPGARLVIAAGRYVVDTPTGRDEGTILCRAATDPWEVDLAGTAGPHAGRTIRAVARLKGELLQLAYDVGGGTRRPRDFTARAGSSIVAVRYKRISAPV